MKLIIVGIQGSGKGTQSQKLADKYGMMHISTGNILRYHIENQTTIGKSYEEDYKNGILASDEILFKMINEELRKKEVQKRGFILDGFPRTEAQLEWFSTRFFINKCIHLNITKKTAMERLIARGRDDDNPKAIKKRVSDFIKKTSKIVDYYKKEEKILEVNGEQKEDDVFKEIETLLHLNLIA